MLAVGGEEVLLLPGLPGVLVPDSPVVEDLEAGQGDAQAAGDDQHLHYLLQRIRPPLYV